MDKIIISRNLFYHSELVGCIPIIFFIPLKLAELIYSSLLIGYQIWGLGFRVHNLEIKI